MSTFNHLLHVHAAAAFDRQLRLADWVEDAEWELDLEAGRLIYQGAGRPSFGVQVLGLEAPGHGWLWAWDQPVRRWPDTLLSAAEQLHALGVKQDVRFLTSPRLPEGQVDGLALAMVASGACQASAFFRCPVPSGVLYCLLVKQPLPQRGELPAWRAAEVFPQVLELLELEDPPLALTCYLRALGMRPEQRGREVRGTGRAGDRLIATFDAKKQLASLRPEMTT